MISIEFTYNNSNKKNWEKPILQKLNIFCTSFDFGQGNDGNDLDPDNTQS